MSTFRSGQSSITVDQADLIKKLDSVTDGAASSFIDRANDVLDTIEPPARTRWPVRTGKSKAAFGRRQKLTPDAIEVALENSAQAPRWGAYAYRIRWSVRTKAGLDAEAAQMRPDSQEVQDYWREARAAGKVKRRKPGQKSKMNLSVWWRSKLTARHGQGAPTEELAGKQPWRVLVRDPGMKQSDALVKDLQTDLAKLAGGA